MYRLLAWAALTLHLLFILWVIFGAIFTRGHTLLSALHIASLLYAIVIEAAVLPCPLTNVEQWALRRAGVAAYEDDFLVHYLDKIVYPGIPLELLVPAAVAVCLFNLGVYVRRWRAARRPGDRS